MIFSEEKQFSRTQFYSKYLLITFLTLFFVDSLIFKTILLLKGKVNIYENDNKALAQLIYVSEHDKKIEVEKELPTNKLLVFDGQIDNTWIEFINIIDNTRKVLYLENCSTMNLENFKIIFETTNLIHTSPTFVRITFI